MNHLRVCILFFALLFYSGCIVIPTPEHGGYYKTRGSIEKESLAFIVPGKTTKEEIILHLGEPDAVLRDRMAFAYYWMKTAGYWAAGGFGAGEGGSLVRQHLLLIIFDDQGLVKSTHHLYNLQGGILEGGVLEDIFPSPNKKIKKLEGKNNPQTQLQPMQATRHNTLNLIIVDEVQTPYAKEGISLFEYVLKAQLLFLNYSLVDKNADMTIHMKVTKFEPGDRAIRNLIGFGAGKGGLTLQACFIDKSGKPLRETTVKQSFYGLEIGKDVPYFADTKENVQMFLIRRAVDKLCKHIEENVK